MIEMMVKKYLVKLLRYYAKKNGARDGQIGIMLQLRENGKSVLFSGWKIEETTKYEHSEWIDEKEVVKMLKD